MSTGGFRERSRTDASKLTTSWVILAPRRFRLFDGHGDYVYPEGWPANIKPLDGVRVLVLHPPNGNYGWNNGRGHGNR